MSSNNNPETGTQTATDTRTNTQIEIGGTPFELHGMSAADGARLYGLLPQEARERADVYADLARRFERLLEIDLPGGMDFNTAWANTIGEMQRNGGSLPAHAAGYMHEIVRECGDQIRRLPLVGGAVGAAEGGMNAAGEIGGAGAAGWDMLMLLPRMLGATLDAGGELVHGAMPGYNAEQARAFGAAVAGAELYQSTMRRAMPFIDMPFNGTASQVWSYPIEHAMAGFDYVIHNIPVLRDVWPYLAAAGTWAYRAITKAPGTTAPTYTEVLNEIKGGMQERRDSGNNEYRDFVEARMRPAEAGRARAQIAEAENIAGVQTLPLLEAMDGQPYAAQDGGAEAFSDANPNTGAAPEVTEVAAPGSEGGQQSRWDRIREGYGQALGSIPQRLGDGQIRLDDVAIVGGGIGLGVGAMRVLPVVGPAVASGTHAVVNAGRQGGINFVSGASREAAEALSTSGRELANLNRVRYQHEQALDRVRYLAERENVLRDQLANAEGRDATRIQRQLNQIDDELLGRRGGLLGRGERTGGLVQRLNGLTEEVRTATATLDEARINRAHVTGEDVGGARGRLNRFNEWREGHAQRLQGLSDRVRGAQAVDDVADAAHDTAEAAQRGGRAASAMAGETAQAAGAAARTGGLWNNIVQGARGLRSRVGSFGGGRVGRILGIAGVASLVASPAIAAIDTVAAEDNTERAIRGTETVATGGLAVAALRIGVGRAFAPAGVVISGAELASAAHRHDQRGMVTSGTALGTMGAGAAAGAALGLAGGPFAPITVPGGALAGLLVGGIGSILTSWGAGRIYDRAHRDDVQVAASRDGAAGPADRGLAEAAGASDPQNLERARAEGSLAFARVSSTVRGGVNTGGDDRQAPTFTGSEFAGIGNIVRI